MPLNFDADPAAYFGIGHNGGPPLDPGASWRRFCWKKAHGRAWKTPPREIALARLARAEELGISYREYASVLLDTGRRLQKGVEVLRRLATALHIDANFAQFTGYDARSRNSIQAIGMPETILQFNLSVKSRCRFAAEAASVAETINH